MASGESLASACKELKKRNVLSAAWSCLTLVSPDKTLSSTTVIWLPDSSKISSLFILTKTSGSFVKLLYLTRNTRRCCSSASSSGKSVNLLLQQYTVAGEVYSRQHTVFSCCLAGSIPRKLKLHHMRIVLVDLSYETRRQSHQSSVPANKPILRMGMASQTRSKNCFCAS